MEASAISTVTSAFASPSSIISHLHAPRSPQGRVVARHQIFRLMRRSSSTPSLGNNNATQGAAAERARRCASLSASARKVVAAMAVDSTRSDNNKPSAANPASAILLSKRRQAAQRGEAPTKQTRPAASGPPRQDMGYPGNGNDQVLLRWPPRSHLWPKDVINVFQFPRNLTERYEIEEVIGTGSFGIVHRAVDRTTGQAYACKSIPKIPRGEAYSSPHYVLKIRSEIDIMSHLGSSLDAVFLVDAFEDDTHFHIVMELCDSGTLMDAVTSVNSTEEDVSLVMRGVFRFLALCHSKDVIYRDVKPENFLFTSNNNSLSRTLKATDFGLAIRHPDGSPPLILAAGTPIYVAPEVFGRCYGKPSDVYSAGVLAFHLLTGRYPYWPNMDFKTPSLHQLQDVVRESNIDFSQLGAEGVSETAQSFLRQVLAKDVSLRITAAEALHHPWIQGNEDVTEEWVPLEGTAVQRLQRYAVYSHLKQKVLAMLFEDIMAEGDDDILGKIAITEMIEPLRSLFELMEDPGHRGSATIHDIVAELEREGYCLSDAETLQLLDSLDTDHDGLVAFSDFAASLLDWDQIVQTPKWGGLLRRVFDRIDHNSDGYINLNEVIGLIVGHEIDNQEIKAHPDREVAAAMIRDFDVDYDGAISWEEFYTCVSEDNTKEFLDCFDKRQSSSMSFVSGSVLWDSSSSTSLDDGQKDNACSQGSMSI